MTYRKITATDLARNVASSIDEVRMTGRPLYITKGSRTIAELGPPPKSGFPLEGLAEFLCSLPSLDEDAEALEADIQKIRKHARIPGSAWDL